MKLKVCAAQILALCAVNLSASAESLSLTLNDAVALALKNNRAIEQYEEDRDSARWQLSQVRRSSGPTLSWSSSSTRVGGRFYGDSRTSRERFYALSDEQRALERYRTVDFPPYEADNSNTLRLSVPLYTGGRLEGQRDAAEYGLNYADLSLENVRQEIKLQAAQAYFQILSYNNIVNVHQEAINILNEHLRTVQIQYEVGTVAMADVLATNVQLANSQQELNTARGNYNNAVATLNNIIGMPADTILVVDNNLSYSGYNGSENDCLNYALEHRPDGIAAEYAVKRAEASVSSARSGFRPSVSAVMEGSISGEGAFKADHTAERWSAGMQLSWNIFDNNVTSAQVQQAKAAQRKAESQARQQIEKIQLDVHNAYTNLKIAEQNINVTSAAVKQAEEQYLIAQVRYEEGVDTNLVVMNAQEKLTQTRTNYFSALYSYNVSVAQLEKAMGMPIEIDAALYAAAVNDGKAEKTALKESAITPLKIFDDKGKLKKRSADDIRPIPQGISESFAEPFNEEDAGSTIRE